MAVENRNMRQNLGILLTGLAREHPAKPLASHLQVVASAPDCCPELEVYQVQNQTEEVEFTLIHHRRIN